MQKNTITSFHPLERTLMGPGPSDVHPRVLEALSRPTIGHLDPLFIGMMDELKQLLRDAFQTGNEVTMPISAPGSAGMECCFVNMLEPGDKVIVCRNGASFVVAVKQLSSMIPGDVQLIPKKWSRP